MKRAWAYGLLLLSSSVWATDSMNYGNFGELSVDAPSSTPNAVVLLLQAPNQTDSELKQQLTQAGALVLGLDTQHFLKTTAPEKADDCAYLAYDFEALSKYVQKQRGFADYTAPILLGRGLGANLAYGAMAQAPNNTFKGVLALDFCPDTRLPFALCGEKLTQAAESGGQQILPNSELGGPWQQFSAAHCAANIRDFTAASPTDPQLDAQQVVRAYTQLAARHAPKTALSDLPLIELPSTDPGDTLAIVVSGDGGWAAIDREVGEYLVKQGIAVVGFNSLKYLWKARTPAESAQALNRVLEYYSHTWQRSRILLIGYSLGADILPFMAQRLPDDMRAKVEIIALLSPSKEVEFEFHPWDWVSDDDSNNQKALPLLPSVQALSALPMLCLYGTQDAADSLCPALKPSAHLTVQSIEGGHHFDDDYQAVAARVLKAAGRRLAK